MGTVSKCISLAKVMIHPVHIGMVGKLGDTIPVLTRNAAEQVIHSIENPASDSRRWPPIRGPKINPKDPIASPFPIKLAMGMLVAEDIFASIALDST
jgi:hypothetical protein